jgi:hypothetical protein
MPPCFYVAFDFSAISRSEIVEHIDSPYECYFTLMSDKMERAVFFAARRATFSLLLTYIYLKPIEMEEKWTC